MAWIKLHQEIRNHPKLIRLSQTLKIKPHAACGHLVFLWLWVHDYSTTGDTSKFSSSELAAAAGYTRDSDRFLTALKSCGWIDDDGMIHNWNSHNGQYFETKEKNRIRQANYRQRNALLTRDDSVSNAPREDKSREDVNREDNNQLDSDRPGFNQFWKAWPDHHRKANRDKCLNKWIADNCESSASEIVQHVCASKHSEQWAKDSGQFIPAPLAYLEKRTYEAPAPPSGDEILEVTPEVLAIADGADNARGENL